MIPTLSKGSPEQSESKQPYNCPEKRTDDYNQTDPEYGIRNKIDSFIDASEKTGDRKTQKHTQRNTGQILDRVLPEQKEIHCRRQKRGMRCQIFRIPPILTPVVNF